MPATLSVLLLLIIVAVLVEAVVETIKMIWKPGAFQVPVLIAIGIGVLVAVVGPFDVFMYLGVPLKVPIVGSVLTGIVMSRGSNYLYDLLKRISALKPPAA
jgi:hypothetical protein